MIVRIYSHLRDTVVKNIILLLHTYLIRHGIGIGILFFWTDALGKDGRPGQGRTGGGLVP